jgi:hypothetical protein
MSACSAAASAQRLISTFTALIVSLNMACALFTLAGLPTVEVGLFIVPCLGLAGAAAAALAPTTASRSSMGSASAA